MALMNVLRVLRATSTGLIPYMFTTLLRNRCCFSVLRSRWLETVEWLFARLQVRDYSFNLGIVRIGRHKILEEA